MTAPDRDSSDRVERLVLALIAIVIAVPLVLWRAWAFTVLWAWFVAPLGFDRIGVAHAIGLLLLVGAFMRRRVKEPKADMRQQIKDQLESGVLTGFALLIGWAASAWVPA